MQDSAFQSPFHLGAAHYKRLWVFNHRNVSRVLATSLDIFDTIRYILNQDERYAALAQGVRANSVR